ncbi:MAG: hypothetical protein MUC61_01995 [Amoebophilaceae bacterium]|nr:hypothetical protein [Amoebophilaceae bacterium]
MSKEDCHLCFGEYVSLFNLFKILLRAIPVAEVLSEDLFLIVLGFELLYIQPLVVPSEDESRKKTAYCYNRYIQSQVATGRHIAAIVSGKFAQAWACQGTSPRLYYKAPLPIVKIETCE